jgi:hypothetical protein
MHPVRRLTNISSTVSTETADQQCHSPSRASTSSSTGAAALAAAAGAAAAAPAVEDEDKKNKLKKAVSILQVPWIIGGEWNAPR